VRRNPLVEQQPLLIARQHAAEPVQHRGRPGIHPRLIGKQLRSVLEKDMFVSLKRREHAIT